MTEEKRKELLDRLKNVTEKEYYPGSKHPEGDRENWHCDFLIYLGHPEIVKEFKKVDKRYS